MKGRLGEAALSGLMKDMVPQKLTKINESAKNVHPSKYDEPEKKQEAPKAPALPAKPVAKKPVLKAAAKKAEEEVKMEIDEIPIRAAPSTIDEMPLNNKMGGMSLDDMPIGGNKQ